MSSSTTVTVPLTVQKQENSEWCWAAVTVSVDLFFRPTSTHTQCDVAGGVLRRVCCSGGKLSKSDPCNVPHALHTVLGRFHLLADDPIRKPLTFLQVKREIDAGRPVCVLVKWRNNDGSVSDRGHFIAIKGYRVATDGKQFLSITDPFYRPSEINYEDFSSKDAGYRNGRGVWFATFLVDDKA